MKKSIYKFIFASLASIVFTQSASADPVQLIESSRGHFILDLGNLRQNDSGSDLVRSEKGWISMSSTSLGILSFSSGKMSITALTICGYDKDYPEKSGIDIYGYDASSGLGVGRIKSGFLDSAYSSVKKCTRTRNPLNALTPLGGVKVWLKEVEFTYEGTLEEIQIQLEK